MDNLNIPGIFRPNSSLRILKQDNIGKKVIYYHPQTDKFSRGYAILEELNVELYTCSYVPCFNRAPEMQCCGKCKNRVYCSKECQVKDWTSHKLDFCYPDPEMRSKKSLYATIRFEPNTKYPSEIEYVFMKDYTLQLFLVDDVFESIASHTGITFPVNTSFEDLISLFKPIFEAKRKIILASSYTSNFHVFVGRRYMTFEK